MKNETQILRKELFNYSKDDLVRLLTSIEEKYNSKAENLREARTKLTKARIRIQVQKQRLQHLRKKVVELTPDSKARNAAH